MKPNGNRVIIELLPEDKVTKSGIIIEGESKDKVLRAQIIEGEGWGSIVLVNKYAGDDFTYEGKDCKVIRIESILMYE